MPTADTPLVVFELANNHMGSVEHGLRVIREIAAASRGFDFDFGFKFQYRDLDTFIHPDFQGRSDIKYVKRFLETRLSEEQFLVLKAEIAAQKLLSVCTPFDEISAGFVEKHGFDYVKIASCSFNDWPLLERAARIDKPMIVSTAGASTGELDRVVSFLEHRKKNFSLLHCVAEYPAKNENLQLNQIDFLSRRYPNVRIGYSAHESPGNLDAVKIAAAKGARVFEKHVGVKTAEYPMNDYSAGPEEIRLWLAAAREALSQCGSKNGRPPSSAQEQATLRSLQRGVFAKSAIKKGGNIELSSTFLAIPTVEGQITANDLSKYTVFTALKDIPAKGPVLSALCGRVEVREKVLAIVNEVNDLLKRAGVGVPGKADFEISHHYGIDRFHEFGCTMITVVNREYCKKLIMVLPGQKHPEQYHKQKEETFHVLHGKILLQLDGKSTEHGPGDVVTVEKGVRHMFESPTGAVIEEISSTHFKDDSFYTDPAISLNKNRKTHLTHWLH